VYTSGSPQQYYDPAHSSASRHCFSMNTCPTPTPGQRPPELPHAHLLPRHLSAYTSLLKTQKARHVGRLCMELGGDWRSEWYSLYDAKVSVTLRQITPERTYRMRMRCAGAPSWRPHGGWPSAHHHHHHLTTVACHWQIRSVDEQPSLPHRHGQQEECRGCKCVKNPTVPGRSFRFRAEVPSQ